MQATALTQGAVYVATGLWPVAHLRSFEAVAGKKRDGWLVQTMGALIAAVGGALLVGATERRASRTVKTLGIASAAVLALADVIFVSKRRIPPIYLADALMESALIGAWIADREIRTLW